MKEEGTYDDIEGGIQCQNCYKNFVNDIKKCGNDHGICLKCYEEIKEKYFRYSEDVECSECNYVFEKYIIKKEFYHENKDYNSEYEYDNNGKYISYWGHISEQFYEDKNGKNQKTLKKFNEEGLLIYEAHYKDGLKNGPYKEYYEDGKQLKEECFYKDDEKEGLCIKYRMDGTKIFENTWKDGEITNFVDEFYENNQKKYESVWLDKENINRKLICYHENGKIDEISYFKGEDIEKNIKYDLNGNIINE